MVEEGMTEEEAEQFIASTTARPPEQLAPTHTHFPRSRHTEKTRDETRQPRVTFCFVFFSRARARARSLSLSPSHAASPRRRRVSRALQAMSGGGDAPEPMDGGFEPMDGGFDGFDGDDGFDGGDEF